MDDLEQGPESRCRSWVSHCDKGPLLHCGSHPGAPGQIHSGTRADAVVTAGTCNQLISGHVTANICSPPQLCVGLEYNTCKHMYDCVTQLDCATVAGSALHFPAGFACTEQPSSSSWCSQCFCELNSVCCCPVCLTPAFK